MAELNAPEVLYCANHPNRETVLRCNRCNKPICVQCAVLTPVGYRCKECVAEQQAVYFTAKSYDYVIAGVITGVLSTIAGFLAPWLVGLIPSFYGWLVMVLIAPSIAGGMAEVVRRGVGKRRGRHLWAVVCGTAIAGSGLGLWLLRLFTGSWVLLSFLIYIVFLISTLYARTR